MIVKCCFFLVITEEHDLSWCSSSCCSLQQHNGETRRGADGAGAVVAAGAVLVAAAGYGTGTAAGEGFCALVVALLVEDVGHK